MPCPGAAAEPWVLVVVSQPHPTLQLPQLHAAGQQQVKIIAFLPGPLLAREDSSLLDIPSLCPLKTGAPVALVPSTPSALVGHGFMLFPLATAAAPSRTSHRRLPGFAGFLAASCHHSSTSESEGERERERREKKCCAVWIIVCLSSGMV